MGEEGERGGGKMETIAVKQQLSIYIYINYRIFKK